MVNLSDICASIEGAGVSQSSNWHQWLTFNCNFTCEYCIMDNRGHRWKPKSRSAKDIVNFWNGLDHAPMKPLTIIGGEPTLHKEFAEIIQNLEGYNITVTTNCASPFFKDDSFVDALKTKPTSHLRMNTSFHPSQKITPAEYKRVVMLMAQAGVHVDQTAFVATPDMDKYMDKLQEVNKDIPLRADVFLGFWTEEDGYIDTVKEPGNFWPHEEVPLQKRGFDNIKDFDTYRDACAESEKYEISDCPVAGQQVMVAPDGNIYSCHYKLYHGIDPVCNIDDVGAGDFTDTGCSHFGFCLACDATQLQDKHVVTPLIVNKLYDKKDESVREVKYLGEELESIAVKEKERFNSKILFESACAFLYSGHNHHGDVLYIGEGSHPLLRYLVRKNYRVTAHTTKGSPSASTRVTDRTLSILSSDREVDKDLAQNFDLILVSENIEDAETLTILGGYLKEGGVMVISANFNTTYKKTANKLVYSPDEFIKKVVEPLEGYGLKRQGVGDYSNIECTDSDSKPDGDKDSFGVLCVRRTPEKNYSV